MIKKQNMISNLIIRKVRKTLDNNRHMALKVLDNNNLLIFQVLKIYLVVLVQALVVAIININNSNANSSIVLKAKINMQV